MDVNVFYIVQNNYGQHRRPIPRMAAAESSSEILAFWLIKVFVTERHLFRKGHPGLPSPFLNLLLI